MPKDTDLHKAAYKGDMRTVQQCVENFGADVNAVGAGGRTPLHRAVLSDSLEIIKYLFSQGADVALTDAVGRTPLHWAAIQNLPRCGELLLSNGADVNAVTKKGASPLHFAAEQGHEKFVRWLLSQPSLDLDLKDANGNSAYDLVKKDKTKSHIRKLLKPGNGMCTIS